MCVVVVACACVESVFSSRTAWLACGERGSVAVGEQACRSNGVVMRRLLYATAQEGEHRWVRKRVGDAQDECPARANAHDELTYGG